MARSHRRLPLSRALAEIDASRLGRLDTARAAVRARVWDLIVAEADPSRFAGDLGDQIVLASTRTSSTPCAGRRRYGHQPMGVICDNTGECLADQLRPGTAGANNAADHIALLTRAIAQIPPRWRRNLLITADGAGATHELLDWITSLNRPADGDDPGMRVEYSAWAGRSTNIPARPSRCFRPRSGPRCSPPMACPALRPPCTASPTPTPSEKPPTSPTCYPTSASGRTGNR